MQRLAGELHTGSLSAIAITLAVTLGAVHALTPGHGKSALVACRLGKEARVTKGIRTALAATFLHVPSGLAAFVVL